MTSPTAAMTASTPTADRQQHTSARVAMAIFLASEVMFFGALFAAYLVLRAGSPPASYSNLFPPAFSLDRLLANPGAASHVAPNLRTYSWPRPFDPATNPLNPILIGLGTLLLLASAVTITRAHAAWRRQPPLPAPGTRWLLATVLLGAIFLAIQLYEYAQLAVFRPQPIGISASGHFRPDSSAFASVFYALTGFHALHVLAGLVALAVLAVRLRPRAGARASGKLAIELVERYWHFVGLVWLGLFVTVYLL